MPDTGDLPEITVVNAVRSEPPAVPVGPLSLCASLERRGVRVQFEDYQAREGPGLGDPAAFASWLAGSAPVLGLSVFSSSLPLVLAAAPRLKASRPDLTLILGGPGTTGVETLILQRFPAVDLVVHGEGEETLCEIMNARRVGGALSGIPGLSYRGGDTVLTTPPRPRNARLDDLPPPAYHLANLAPYQDPRWRSFTPFGVFLSRGCAFRCTFCAIPDAWQGEVHTRTVDAVVSEIRELEDRYGIDSFRVLDDTFTLDRRRAIAFCERMAASGLALPWLCHARVDLMDEALLAALKAAGCQLVFYGLESGSDRVLRRLGKTFSVSRALDVVEMSRRHVEVETSFMWGFPFESMDDLYDTLVALLAVHDMGARTKLSWFVPFPAMALMREHGDMLGRVFRHEAFPARSHMDAYPPGPELLDLVCGNRDLFPNFFYLDYPGHDEKMRYLKRRALGETDARPEGGAGPARSRSGTARARGAGPLPMPVDGASVRSVGGRGFAFDAARLRAFRISPFGESVFRACERHEALEGLVTELAARHARDRSAVRDAVRHVLDRFEAEGLIEADPRSPSPSCPNGLLRPPAASR